MQSQKRLRPQRLIVTSFKQDAVDRFHELIPGIGVAPGIDGVARWFLAGASPGPGVVAFQVPITYRLDAGLIRITTADSVAAAHADGYAWHNWFGDEDADDPPTWEELIDICVDGIMTSRPRKLEKTLKHHPAPDSCPGG